MMNKRITELKTQLFEHKREISLERTLLYTESYKETEGEPVIVRRAKATAHILNNVQISIREGELIVGNRTIKSRSGIISPEMDPYWIYEELDSIHNRPQDTFYISEEDKKIYKEQLYSYWVGKSMKDFINSRISMDVKVAMEKDVIILNQTDKGQGHIIMDYEGLLENGIQDILSQIREKSLQKPENDFYNASLIVMEAAQKHILRYCNLALMEADSERNVLRKDELLEIARISKKIACGKPESFQEALQLLWYISIIGQYESNASSLSLGRFDQYMYKFYRRDLEEGIANGKT